MLRQRSHAVSCPSMEAGKVSVTTYEPYSNRKRQAEKSGMPNVYQYDELPDELMVQIYYALQSGIGRIVHTGYAGGPEPYPNVVWSYIENLVKRERGVTDLTPRDQGPEKNFLEYIRSESDIDRILDAIEIAVRQMQSASEEPYYGRNMRPKVAPVIEEINRRFREHDCGYEFAGVESPGVIVKIDSQFIHAEVVEPAIATLHANGFSGPLDEFVKAHQEYRRGHHKDAMNEALKAFESTMKAICGAKGWHYEQNWTAKMLIKALFDNGLIPTMLENYFNSIRTILESGVPTLRNKQSGHGQGAAVTAVPDYFAAFTLHLTAANIVFLMSAYEALP